MADSNFRISRGPHFTSWRGLGVAFISTRHLSYMPFCNIFSVKRQGTSSPSVLLWVDGRFPFCDSHMIVTLYPPPPPKKLLVAWVRILLKWIKISFKYHPILILLGTNPDSFEEKIDSNISSVRSDFNLILILIQSIQQSLSSLGVCPERRS